MHLRLQDLRRPLSQHYQLDWRLLLVIYCHSEAHLALTVFVPSLCWRQMLILQLLSFLKCRELRGYLKVCYHYTPYLYDSLRSFQVLYHPRYGPLTPIRCPSLS